MNKNKDSIYLDRWLELHPFRKSVSSDLYYLRLCNEAYGIIKEYESPAIIGLLNRDEMMSLACFIISYFEDVISGPGLWLAFTNQVRELYGRDIPFFETDPDDYYPDEINMEDIQFLLWYFVSMAEYDKTITSPFMFDGIELPYRLFDLLEREYELAPENQKLKQFLSVGPEDDLNALQEKMGWIMTDSWLFHFQGAELEELIREVQEEEGGKALSEETMELYMVDMISSFVLSTRTALLARQGKEWLAHLMGREHPLFQDIINLGEKKSGFYLFVGKENDYLLFEHVASGKLLDVNLDSMQFSEWPEEGKALVYTGFVKWKNNWWHAGSYVEVENDPDLIRQEQESEEERYLFEEDSEFGMEEYRKKQYDAFLMFNKGKRMVFLGSEKEVGKYLEDFMLFRAGSSGLPAREKRLHRKIIREFDLAEENDTGREDLPDESIPGMLFYNTESGFEMAFGLNRLIPDPDNPWYAADDDLEKDSMNLLVSGDISGEWMNYLFETYDLPGISFPGEEGESLLQGNLDFMVRFWKREGYLV